MWLRLCAWCLAATFPSSARLPGLDRVDPLPFLRQLQREAPPAIRWALHASVLVFLLTPVLTIGVPLPAKLLSADQVDRHALALAGHRVYLLRQVMVMIKTVGGLCWGADASIRAPLGLPPYLPDPGTWRA